MEKKVLPKPRVLARRLAEELNSHDLEKIRGRGTSYYGTLGCDSEGRGGDMYAGDSTDNDDVFICN